MLVALGNVRLRSKERLWLVTDTKKKYWAKIFGMVLMTVLLFGMPFSGKAFAEVSAPEDAPGIMGEETLQATPALAAAQSNSNVSSDKTILDWFDSRGSTNAKNAILNCTYASYTKAGDSADATDLHNVKRSLEYLLDFNETYRKALGLSELKVNDLMMAYATANANYSAQIWGHSRQFNVGENLARGYSDPYQGWYTAEKKIYDDAFANGYYTYDGTQYSVDPAWRNYSLSQLNAAAPNFAMQVGHYLNIILPGYQMTGFALNTSNRTCSQTFSQVSSSSGVDVQTYYNEFMEYYNANAWPKDIGRSDIVIRISPLGPVFTGSAICPSVTITDVMEDTTLQENVDYKVEYANNTNASKDSANVKITGIGSYTGVVTKAFEIYPESISRASYSIESQYYTGEAVTPPVELRFNGSQLVEGKDYRVDYSNNVNIGSSAVAKITGMGNFSGTVTRYFTIKRSPDYDLSNATVEEIPPQQYTGNPIVPSCVVTLAGKTLVQGRDFTVRCTSGNVDVVCNVFTQIEGIGDYGGSKQVMFAITSAPLTSISLSQTTYTYDGTSKKPDVTVKFGDRVLTNGVDYYIPTPYDLVSAGGKMLTAYGRGNFGGLVSARFQIKPAQITSFVVEPAERVYNGGQQRPTFKVKAGDLALVEWNDFTSTCVPNDYVNVGTKTITVQAARNFTGTLTATYTILPQGSTIDPTPVPSPDPTPAPTPQPTPTPKPTPGDGPSQSQVKTQAMYRLYNPNSGEHFYTANAGERDNLAGIGWGYEGVAWNAPVSGKPVYRMYNPNVGDHHYTPNLGERDALVGVGWNYEGICWYTPAEGGAPLYRLYNPNAVTGSHHYTTSEAERDNLVQLGWKDEGIGWYGM